jgi:hypothetical protein
MIIKSIGMPIKAVGYLLDYILREGSKLVDGNGLPLLFKQHLRGTTPNEWAREFVALEQKRKKKNKRARGLYHVILSLHRDKVTIEMLERFGREFLKLRCPNSLAIVTAHADEHLHLHLVISGVQIGSYESIRIERSEFSDILKCMADFQGKEYPELKFSKVSFGKKPLSKDVEYKMKSKGIVPERQLILVYALAALDNAHSIEDFVEIIRIHGLEPYYQKNELVGIKGNKKYRLKTLGISLLKLKVLQRNREVK